MNNEMKSVVEGLTPIEGEIGRFALLVKLVDAVTDYYESVMMFQPGLDSYSAIEVKQISVAKAFLRACGIPAGPDDAFSLAPEPEPQPRPPVYQKAVISGELRWAVWSRDNFTCQGQGCGARQFLQVDHIVPESKGGPMTLENLRTLCKACNMKKGNRG